MGNRTAFMDYTSASPLDDAVVESMEVYFKKVFGNPSSLHSLGVESRKAVVASRESVKSLIGGETTGEIVFTSGATESNNLALKGMAYRNRDRGNHIVTSTIEHISTLNICKYLSKKGFEITYIPVDNYGRINLDRLEDSLTEKTILISIAYANGEIGTLQPIREISSLARSHNVLLHVDGTVAVGKMRIDVQDEGIDLLTVSSNDIYGPKGIGGLYMRSGIKIEPILHGGGQEQGLRSGSENVPSIVGFGKAAEIMKSQLNKESDRSLQLRDRLIKGVLEGIPESFLNGHPTLRLPTNVHLRFNGIEGESLILKLDEVGIYASTGSACSSITLEPSHVLMGIGLNEVEAHGSLLLSLGRWNTIEDVDYVLAKLPKIVSELRAISPIWQKEIEIEKWKKMMDNRGHH